MINKKEYSGGINGIPQSVDRKAMWESLTITTARIDSPAINDYVEHLSQYYTNGSVKYGCFELGESEALDWYCSGNRLQGMFFFKRFGNKSLLSAILGLVL